MRTTPAESSAALRFSNTSAKIVGDSIQPEKMDGLYSRKIDGVVTLIMLYATLDKSEYYLGG